MFCRPHLLQRRIPIMLSIFLSHDHNLSNCLRLQKSQVKFLVAQITITNSILSRSFHPNVDSPRCTALLSSQPLGTYLFRPSSELGFIVCGVVTETNQVVQTRISVDVNGFHSLEGEHFLTLDEYISSRHTVLIQPLTSSA